MKYIYEFAAGLIIYVASWFLLNNFISDEQIRRVSSLLLAYPLPFIKFFLERSRKSDQGRLSSRKQQILSVYAGYAFAWFFSLITIYKK